MPAFLAAIIGWFIKSFSVELIKMAIFRILLASAIGILLPIALYNIYCDILKEVVLWIQSNLESVGLEGQVLQLVGVGAWLVGKLRVPECLSIYTSALAVKMTLSFLTRRFGI